MADDIKIVLSVDANGAVVGIKNVTRELGTLNKEISGGHDSVKKFENDVASLGNSFRRVTQFFGAARFAAMDFYNIFLQLPEAVLKTSGELERLTKLMEGFSSATTKAARQAEALSNTKFIIKTALSAPFDVKTLSDAFVKLKSAGIDPLNGSFQAIIDSVAKFGGTSETIHRATIAIQQMAGKGVISMEELRQQLGEAVPNAIGIMADSMGISVARLVKYISSGQIQAKGGLERMFLGMQAVNAGAALNMMNTWTGMLAQLKTRFMLFEQDIGNSGFLDGMKDIVKQLSTYLSSNDGKKLGIAIGEGLTTAIDLTTSLVHNLIDLSDTLKIVGAGFLTIFVASKATAIISGLPILFQTIKAEVLGYSTITSAAMEKVNAEWLKSALLHNEVSAMIEKDTARLVAAEERLTLARLNGGRGARQKIVLAEAEIVALRATTVANTEAAAAIKASAVATRDMGTAMAALSGWFGWLTIALTVGTVLWEKWGNAAEKAKNQANKDLSHGTATQVTITELVNEQTHAYERLALAKGKIKNFDPYGKIGANAAPGSRLAQAQADAAKQQAIIDDTGKKIEIARAQISQRAITEEERISNDETDRKIGLIADAASREIAVRKSKAQELIDEQALNGAQQQKLLDDVAKKNAETMRKSDAEQYKVRKNAFDQAQAAYDKFLADGHSKTEADAKWRLALVTETSKKMALAFDQMNRANNVIGTVATGGIPKTVNDPLRNALETARGNLAGDLELLKDAGEKAKTYEQLRASIAARVEGRRQAGLYDISDPGNKGVKIRPGANSQSQKDLTDILTQDQAAKRATAALDQAYNQREALDEKMALANDRAITGNPEKQASAVTRMIALLAKLRDGFIPGSAALVKFNGLTNHLVSDTAMVNLQDFVADLQIKSNAIASALLPTDVGRREAVFMASEKRIHDQFDLKIKDIQRAGDFSVETEKKVDLAKQQFADAEAIRAKQHERDMRTPLEKMVEDWHDGTKQMGEATAKWANDTIEAFVTMAETGKFEMSALVTSILKDILRMQLKEQMGNSLNTAFGAAGKFLKDLIFKKNDPNAADADNQNGEGFYGNVLSKTLNQTTATAAATTAMTGLGTVSNGLNSVFVMLANAGRSAAAALGQMTGGSSFGGSGLNLGGLFGGSGTASMAAATPNDGFLEGLLTGAFANGGIMSKFGSLPLHKYSSGGVARTPQLAMFGEGSMNEAYVPLPDGRSIPVSMKGGGEAPNVQVNVINQSGTQVNASKGQPRFDGRQMILDVVLTAASTAGPFRDGMKQAVG